MTLPYAAPYHQTQALRLHFYLLAKKRRLLTIILLPLGGIDHRRVGWVHCPGDEGVAFTREGFQCRYQITKGVSGNIHGKMLLHFVETKVRLNL
jgi:hypothetical protein